MLPCQTASRCRFAERGEPGRGAVRPDRRPAPARSVLDPGTVPHVPASKYSRGGRGRRGGHGGAHRQPSPFFLLAAKASPRSARHGRRVTARCRHGVGDLVAPWHGSHPGAVEVEHSGCGDPVPCPSAWPRPRRPSTCGRRPRAGDRAQSPAAPVARHGRAQLLAPSRSFVGARPSRMCNTSRVNHLELS